jgi:hypothetical protein
MLIFAPHTYKNVTRIKQTCKLLIHIFLRLAVVSMAGLAAEGLQYDKVVGQSADLFTLQVL